VASKQHFWPKALGKVRWGVLFLTLSLGCVGPCARNPSDLETLEEKLTLEHGTFSLYADKHQSLRLTILRVLWRDERLVVAAEGDRDDKRWAFGLLWEHPLRLEKGFPVFEKTGRCTMRYLQDGRATGAHFLARDIKVEAFSSERGNRRYKISWVCEKRFENTVSGKPYAKGLPNVVRVEADLKIPEPQKI
jgi:hypothetical protein